jgi:hypothetical protein
MNVQLITAVLLTFNGAAAADLARVPRYNLSQMNHVVGPWFIVATLPGDCLAIYLFIKGYGVGYGLGYWAALATLSLISFKFMIDGFRTILGITALVAGYITFLTLW